ncbi:unnamed protein product, partial [Ixodes hexagonus]
QTSNLSCHRKRLVIARLVAMTAKMLSSGCLVAAILLVPSAFADATEATDAACLDVVNITFSSPAPLKFEFEASPSSEAVSMNHLYSITNYFIALVITRPGVPKALLDEHMFNDPIAVLERDHKMILTEFKGLLALVAIGILLAVLVPFVGVIVLCCRCCRRCGGAKNMAEKKGDAKWRGFLGLFLFFAVVAMLFAIVCAFVTNSYIPGGIDGISVQVDHTITDVSQLINKTKGELDTLLVTNYGEFQGSLEKRLDTCTKSIGDEFSGLISGPPFSDVKNITENLQTINTKMGAIQTSVGELNGIIRWLSRKVPEIKQKLNDAAAQCEKDGATPEECSDISNAAGQVLEIKEVDLTEFNNTKRSVEDLNPDQLAKEVSQALDTTARREAFLKDVGKTVDALKKKLTDTGATLTDISAKIDPTVHLSLSEIKKEPGTIRDTINVAKPYVVYYNYATLTIAAILTFVLLAYVLGLTWGGCGSRDGSCSRGSGGSWLSAGGTIFILAFFIPMLLSTVLLSIGLVGQRSTCDLALNLDSPEAESLIRFAYGRALSPKMELRTGGEVLDADVVVGIVRRFAECRDTPRGLYGLLGEELVTNVTRFATSNAGGSGGISFELLLDDSKSLDFDAETRAFMDEVQKLKLGDVVSKDLDAKLAEVEKVNLTEVQKKIAEYKAKLGIRVRGEYLSNLRFADDIVLISESGEDLQRMIQDLQRESSVVGLKINMKKSKRYVACVENPQVFAKEKIEQIKTELDEITRNVTSKAVLYKDKFVEFANVYVNHTRRQVKEHVGDCKPAYAVYQASVNAVCGNVLLPFNGYWFSVGAFMVIGVPALILALCLASLYHRVDPSLAILESLSRGDSDHVSGGSYMDSDTIPLARVNRKRRQGGGSGGGVGGGVGGRGVYDNRDGYLHDVSPEYRDHSAQQPPHRNVAGVVSPGVAYMPAPTYQYSRDPGLVQYGKGYQPMPPAMAHRVPSGEWDASGQFGAKPPPYYYPGA